MLGIRAIGCACVVTMTTAGAGEAKEAPLKNPSAWEPSLGVKVAGGYKDNAALSQSRPEASAFVRTSLDAIAVRLPVDGNQCTLVLLGEDTRYFSSKTVDHESFVFGQAEARRFWPNDWQAAFSVESAFLDQVIDLSVTETNRTRLVVRGGTLIGRPIVRRELSAHWWLEAEAPLTRQMFDGLPDDYWVLAPKLALGRTFGAGSEVTLAYEFGYRHYDTDPARQLDRTAIPNETRVSHQQELQVSWKQFWDVARRWRTVTKCSHRQSADQVGSYFDYRRTTVSEQVRFREGPWELSLEGRLAWYHFPHQAGSDDRQDRERTDITVLARGERAFGRRWRVFAEYEHAATDSSLELEEYTAHTVLAGMEVEF
jgi:hypothetical protein